MGSNASNLGSPPRPSRGKYACTCGGFITWEVWHNDMLFPEDVLPGDCRVCKKPYQWQPAGGIPHAEAVGFEPPDMEDFIDGILD